jgi:hypothetical protein
MATDYRSPTWGRRRDSNDDGISTDIKMHPATIPCNLPWSSPLSPTALAQSSKLRMEPLQPMTPRTPSNTDFVWSRLPVDLIELTFPSLPPLPAVIESTDIVPCPSLHLAFLHTTTLLRDPFTAYLASLQPRPLTLISDFFLGFTRRVTADADIPRSVFNDMSCFASAIYKATNSFRVE